MHIYCRHHRNQPAALGGSDAIQAELREGPGRTPAAGRSRTEEKQRKKEEKATLRKAQREAAVAPNPDEPAVRSEASPDAKLRGMLDEREP